ncbi:Crp/Fnr family transcriptional regulator [Flavobacterium sp. Fl-77]|uniref:Crp/Fnr family transcriptional regulator n=1 Tax=Flavobacterium flavipigmentatum TaxID=2893884 RepID=A0AAJ2S874_9FLAO|nr:MULTISPECIES: Crp/Fnr family transcriptional regulator [unclassified Flavobacterium]MDX6182411.1 Crp/Fnr family transcriptional regulator [Flavobacterium sp. Fl-33]MDX6185676.1 Crp/Fnr family transcriptional regulator [Flavobacterium sp. Fl-77]UFH38860.1 Crp/Fnr family transcriptional regulator [Flavobacterium sp. F-70]
MISESLLIQYGAIRISIKKTEILFNESDKAKNFYQMYSGEIKMHNFNDDGKEFIQGIFTTGDSFGEPPLLINKKYPANATAIIDSEVYALKRDSFIKLLQLNPEVNLQITTALAQRLYFKSIMASEISSQEPEHRIIKLIDYFKETINKTTVDEKYQVDLTRQQIADFTGLRVETVIRAIKSLEKKKLLYINKGKVFR